jgi:thiosulfate/3-mercaptopyruvate sulfurtransferase
VQKLGINKDSKIVIVYPGLTPKDVMCGTRTFWTFSYYGMENISILDGGFGKWKRDGYKITNETKTPAIGNFVVEKINDALLASLDQTKDAALSKNSALLDSRMVSDYVGKTKQDFIPDFGHISGSVNYFAPLYLNADLTFKSSKQIIFEMGLLGIKDGMNIVTYCNSGQFATTAWFALSEIAGFKGVSSYDGSVSEWVNQGHLPLTKDSSVN